ncbi:MAG: VPLPA-CTERM sorting domain-containing protein [Candidatus Rokubacteria bacterium]|nr:VPLPA-CTERM sorting domain-containing protein [Candidatus Rokubacteria bacterium]MBI3107126.1 VPLPA-CTERM sorting domain-containing protein [Candidatus Rokubacteria bacterium]
MSVLLRTLVVLVLVMTSASGAMAVPAFWTDWTTETAGAPGVLGSLTVGSSTVDVAFSGSYFFAQTSGGTNFWSPGAPYISSTVDNAPPASDIIALGSGGLATITFSEPVEDPLLALVSWNGNVVDFGVPIEILSFGCGFFGCGTPLLNAGSTGFTGAGEVHGVIRLPGAFSSISFTHTSEFWHGLTVGVLGLAEPPPPPPTGVPAPASLVLLGLGLAGLAAARRRKQR